MKQYIIMNKINWSTKYFVDFKRYELRKHFSFFVCFILIGIVGNSREHLILTPDDVAKEEKEVNYNDLMHIKRFGLYLKGIVHNEISLLLLENTRLSK